MFTKKFYKKFNGAEQYIKERIEVFCSKSKLSAKEVTYLLTKFVKIFWTKSLQNSLRRNWMLRQP